MGIESGFPIRRVKSLESSRRRISGALRGFSVPSTRNRVCAGTTSSQANALSDGTVTASMTQFAFPIKHACQDVRIVFNNYGFDDVGPNNITVKCAIVPPAGADTVPVFFAGRRSVVVEPGAFVISDPVPVVAAAATTIYVRTYCTVTGGQKFPLNNQVYGFALDNPSNWAGLTGTSVSDTTDQIGTVTGASANAAYYTPCAVIAYDPADSPNVAIFGDSVSAGVGNVTSTGIWGWAEIGLSTNNTGFVNLSRSGESAADVLATSSAKYRNKVPLLASATHALMTHGINDITANTSAGTTNVAAVQVKLIAFWKLAGDRGIPAMMYTLPPRTTSTDSWVTTVNQTALTDGRELGRTTLNAWIRDGAPILNGVAVATGSSAAGTLRAGNTGHPLVGYMETADLVETARDSGIWKASNTADGTHPNATGAAAMSAAVTTSLSALVSR